MRHSKKLAPVLLFAYNRVGYIRSTLDALKNNILAKNSDLYIYSDAPKDNRMARDVAEVREYVHSIGGFKDIYVIERETNFGLAKNIIEGVSEIIGRHDKVIVLEDDLLTSRNFLCYTNAALDYYNSRDDIFSIAGYSPRLNVLQEYGYDSYLSYRPASWGWATWRDQWEGVDWGVSDFGQFIKNKTDIKRFNRGGVDMTRMLKHCMEGRNQSWAIRWAYAMFRQDKYAVYPKASKIQNIGFGEDATNCSGVNIYKTFMDDSFVCDFEFVDDVEPDKSIAREFRYQYSYTNKLIKKTAEFIRSLRNEA